MPALEADIFAASRDSVKANWESTAIAARYPSARDGSATPNEGFFDLIADAQTVINARGTLIGTERRRFAVVVDDLVWPNVSTSLPQVSLIDSEQGVNGTFLVARFEIDLEAETSSFELFG
jgi:hypothetical protein